MIKHIIVLILFSQVAFSQIDTLWTKIYFPDEDTLDFIGRSLQPTLDGGFIILGEQNNENIEPEIFLLKAGSDGENLWTTVLPHSIYDKVRAYSIDVIPDSGFVVLTMESNDSCYDDMDSSTVSTLVLFKLDASGDTIWTRSYLQDYSHDQYDICNNSFGVIASQDGDLILYGKYYVDEEFKTWILKTNSLGEPIWGNTYDFNNTEGVTLGPDGSIFITGGYGGWGAPGTAFILKINPNGDQEWVQYESESVNTNGRIIHSTIDNGLVVCGQYSSDYYTGPWLWKTDSLGNTEWDINLDDAGINGIANFVQHPDGTYIIAGHYGQGVFSYLLLNTNDSTSNSFTYEGFSYQAIDIKLLSESTQITLVHNYQNKIGIVKTLYTNSSDCTADNGTEGVELWGECYSIDSTTMINLWYGTLDDTIPTAIGNLINLTSLSLPNNQLHGQIPIELGNLTNLTELNLQDNQLTGEIPSSLGNLTNLNSLSLSGNSLTGEIPIELFNLVNLSGYVTSMMGGSIFHPGLDLSNNLLSGEIPPEIGNLANINSIYLSLNQLSGEIPIELYSLTNLESLSLSDNLLSGEISPTVSNLINLSGIVITGHMSITTYPALDLSTNQFSGAIPEDLCSLSIDWAGNVFGDSVFSIHQNQFCPPYPSCIEEYVGDQDTTNCNQVSIFDETLPITYNLYNAYPNPFNPITTLRYDLPEDAMVNITIYDMMGRKVSTLVSNQKTAGFKSIQWNATNDKGQPVSAGLYLYTIQAGEFRQTKKMVLLK